MDVFRFGSVAKKREQTKWFRKALISLLKDTILVSVNGVYSRQCISCDNVEFFGREYMVAQLASRWLLNVVAQYTETIRVWRPA